MEVQEILMNKLDKIARRAKRAGAPFADLRGVPPPRERECGSSWAPTET